MRVPISFPSIILLHLSLSKQSSTFADFAISSVDALFNQVSLGLPLFGFVVVEVESDALRSMRTHLLSGYLTTCPKYLSRSFLILVDSGSSPVISTIASVST